MLIVKESAPGVFEEIAPGSSFNGPGGVLHSWQVTDLWDTVQLASIGVYRVAPAVLPADPQATITGYHFERNGMDVVQVLDVVAAPALTKYELKTYLAQVRLDKEVGGMSSETFGQLLTDRETRSIIAQTIQSIDLGIVQAPITWKAPSGFVVLDRAAFVGIATEVANFVQQTFDKESQVSALIDSGDVSTKAEILTAFAS